MLLYHFAACAQKVANSNFCKTSHSSHYLKCPISTFNKNSIKSNIRSNKLEHDFTIIICFYLWWLYTVIMTHIVRMFPVFINKDVICPLCGWKNATSINTKPVHERLGKNENTIIFCFDEGKTKRILKLTKYVILFNNGWFLWLVICVCTCTRPQRKNK